MDKSKFAVDTYDKIADIYTKQYFDDLSDIEYIDKFLKLLPRNANVLDVGSGPGQFSKYIISKGFCVIGIDFSQKMIDIAKEKVSNVTFKQMDMRKLNFENNYFDGLLVAYSLIHIPSTDIHKTIDGFHRVLKQNGVIEFITQKGEADKIIDEPFMPSEKMFFNFFTKEKITNFLTKANFKIEFLEETDSHDPNSVGNKIIYTIARKI